jgi:GTPase SAR1 family protein
MNNHDPLDEVVRIAASVGAPAVLLIVALSIVGASGLAGAAALTAALALLGGPAGIPGGILVLTFVGGVSAALASYGLEALLVAIYHRRIEISENPDVVDVVVQEVNSNRLLRNSQKRTIISAITKTFSILIVGRTGTGKSSTINSLLGRDVAPVGEVVPVTSKVESFDCTINDATVCLYDTPGLCDSADMSNDDAYIAAIKEVLPSIDLVVFVTPLNETRVSRDERIALRSLSAAIGKELWENMIVVFTFACSPLPGQARFDSFFDNRANAFKEFVAQISSEKIATGLPFLAVDNSSEMTPDGCEWVPELFTIVVERCSASGVMPFVEALGAEVGSADNSDEAHTRNGDQASSADTKRINLNEEQRQRVKRGLKRSVIGGAIIGAVAAVVAVPGGVIMGAPLLLLGGATGAAVGFWRWISKR